MNRGLIALLAGLMAVSVFIIGMAARGSNPGFGQDNPEIAVTVDRTTVILGTDLAITYTVTPSGASFDSVTVQIKNSGGTVVAEWANQSGASGPHTLTWDKAKWNTGTHNGAYAHPKNGSYTVWGKGYKGGQVKDQDSKTVDTKLVIEADFEDPKPGADEISSGLDKNATDTGFLDSTYITAGLKPSSGDIVWDSGSPTFSNLVLEDMDNDASSGDGGKEIKSVHFLKEWSSPSDIPEGQHKMVFKGVLDQAGNEGLDGYTDGVVSDWAITLY